MLQPKPGDSEEPAYHGDASEVRERIRAECSRSADQKQNTRKFEIDRRRKREFLEEEKSRLSFDCKINRMTYIEAGKASRQKVEALNKTGQSTVNSCKLIRNYFM